MIHLFFFTGLGLVDEFINELDLPVNKIFNDGIKQKVTAKKDHSECNQGNLPVLQEINSKTDQHRQQQGR